MSKCVLISIKPKYVNLIAEGFKKYEFRREIPRSELGKPALVYASAPIKKIVGMIEFGRPIVRNAERLWGICAADAGIDKKAFMRYFEGCGRCYALPILCFSSFGDWRVDISHHGLKRPPQNYCYIDVDFP